MSGYSRRMRSQAWYSRFARASARLTGNPATFALAVLVIVVWVINTGSTIVTILMVFLIQNAQNRDTDSPEA